MASQNEKPQVTIEALREIAKAHGFTMRPQDEPGYLRIAQAAQASVEFVEQMDDYIEPSLLRDLDVDRRTYTVPSPSGNPLNAWSHRTFIKLPTATDGSPSGLLAGRTVAIKDNTPVAGVPQTNGTQPLPPNTTFAAPALDAPVVSRVLAAGAAVTGTSTCENYCLSAMSCTSATGPVQNPWRAGRSAGGSSGGSAALVAVNFMKKVKGQRKGFPDVDVEGLGEGVDMATGADQGGSIRVPAAYCGVYGLKPTHGLVPYTGLASLTPLLDHCGPIASSVRDTALLLSVLAGSDGMDPRMTPETPLRAAVPQYHALLDAAIAARQAAGTWTPTSAARGLRVGILKEGFETAGLDTAVADAVRSAAARFARLGAAAVDPVSVPAHQHAPHVFTAATRAYIPDHLLLGLGAATSPSLPFPFPCASPRRPLDQTWYDTMTAANPLVPGALLSGAYVRSAYPERARDGAARAVRGLRAAYEDALARYDVLVLPATPTAAPAHWDEESGDVADKAEFLVSNTLNTLPFNVTGLPGFVIPVGWISVGDDGARLPVAMQIVGKRWDEQTLFLAAAAWEVGGMGLDGE
ncbi:amidase signature enzyme [Hypoxylon sp. FL1284]|nr:amidase signature enzyme [Hypoxylon sp. FL1284]